MSYKIISNVFNFRFALTNNRCSSLTRNIVIFNNKYIMKNSILLHRTKTDLPKSNESNMIMLKDEKGKILGVKLKSEAEQLARKLKLKLIEEKSATKTKHPIFQLTSVGKEFHDESIGKKSNQHESIGKKSNQHESIGKKSNQHESIRKKLDQHDLIERESDHELFDSENENENEKKEEKEKKTKGQKKITDLKRLALSSRSSEHDLLIKFRQIKKWLEKDIQVKILITGSHDEKKIMENIFKKFEQEMKDTGRIVQKKFTDSSFKFVLQPMSNAINKSHTDNKDSKKDFDFSNLDPNELLKDEFEELLKKK